MPSKGGAVVSALITLLLFVGIPYVLPSYIPPDLLIQMEQSGFDLASFIDQIMIIGAITAGLTLAVGFLNPNSLTSLIARLAQAGLSLIFIVVFLSAGDLSTLGYTQFEVAMEDVTSSIAMDLRVFVYISIGTILLKMLQVYLSWNEERIESAPPGRIAP